MKKVILYCAVILYTGLAFGFEGTFFDESAVPSSIENVEMRLFDMARTEEGCTYDQCFRIDIYLNGVWVARWGASPGDPLNDQPGFNGVNTPKYNGRSLNKSRLMGPGYISGKGDAMPYAMFILGSQGQNTGFALHAGETTGLKESHGCIRLEYANAQRLNAWVKEAMKENGGTAKIWSEHTTD